jgi:hypothetical protein
VKKPFTGEVVFATGIQGMEVTPVMVLIVRENHEDKWSFVGKRIYPGAIDNVEGFLYTSREAAEADNQPVTTAKCWRKFDPVNELIDDLVVALAKFQSSLS